MNRNKHIDAQVRLELLGPPRLTVDGSPIDISRKKSMALVAWIALHDNPVPRERMVALLWPQAEPSKGKHALRSALYSLSLEAGTTVVLSNREFLSLGENISVDCRELAKYDRELEVEEPFSKSYVESLRASIELYRGNLLDGFEPSRVAAEYDDFIMQQDEMLRRLVGKLRAKAVRSATLRGEMDEALEHARAWARLDSLDEAPHRRLMELHAWSGRKDLASGVFNGLSERLQTELGTDPEEETTLLMEAIRSNALAKPLSAPGSHTPAWEGQGVRAGFTSVLSISIERAATRFQSREPYDAASVVDLFFQDALAEILNRRSAYDVMGFGDRIGALFGFPSATGDDAYNAIMAGIEILQAASAWELMLTVAVGSGLVYRRDDSMERARYSGPGIRNADLLRYGADSGHIYLDDTTAEHAGDAIPVEEVFLSTGETRHRRAWLVKIIRTG